MRREDAFVGSTPKVDLFWLFGHKCGSLQAAWEVWGQTPVQARLLVGHEQYEANEYLITLDNFTQR